MLNMPLSEARLGISRKAFASIETSDLALVRDEVLSPPLSNSILRLKAAVGPYIGNLELLRTRGFLDAIDELAETIASTDIIQGAEYEGLLVISNLMLLRMHFKQYQKARSAACSILDRVIDDVFAQPQVWAQLNSVEFKVILSRCIEAGSYSSQIANLYDGLSETVKRDCRPIMRGATLAAGDSTSYRKKSSAIAEDAISKEFGSWVEGKSVAIVAPADVGLASGVDIDKADIVVRFNHVDGTEYDAARFGTRTDASYFTDPAFKKLVLKTKNKLSSLVFAVPQNTSNLKSISGYVDLEARVRSQYRSSNEIFFKSHGNAVQRMLLDILRFGVKSLKVFNSDMWLTPHNQSYAARRSMMDPHMFIHHDPVANFIFTQRLHSAGVIQVDAVLARVLDLDLNEYINQLDSLYGQSFRNSQVVEDRPPQPQAPPLETITFVHIRSDHNVGDRWCSPYDYVGMPNSTAVHINSKIPPSKAVIFGGGAIEGLIKKLDLKSMPGKKIAWGIGVSRHKETDLTETSLEGIDLLGIREWGRPGGVYVPCASCLSTMFDRQYDIHHDVVMFVNANTRIKKPPINGLPTLDNSASFEDTIRWLGSGSVVVTNSYHGVYWATLLGRKVVCLPYSSKFYGFKHPPAMVTTPSEWRLGVAAARSYPEALADCRNATLEFRQRVLDLLEE